MKYRRLQQLAGLFIALLGVGWTAWAWYTTLKRGYFSYAAGTLFPFFFIMGTGLILFPGYREERIARGEDISELQGLKLLTPRWWAILIIGLLVAAGNHIALRLSL